MKTGAILLAAAGLAAAKETYYGLIAVDSTTPIHLREINANGYNFWIGKKTASFCPNNVKKLGGCPPGKDTTVTPGSSGTLFMGAEVPGGQQVYIDRSTGAVKYTVAHTEDTEGGITNGWTLSPVKGQNYSLLKYKRGLVACPTTKQDQYQVFANLKNVDFSPACIGPFDSIAAPSGSKPSAWQYV